MPDYDSGPIANHPVVSHEQWLDARVRLLDQEKEFSRARDELHRRRRALPWERVGKTYRFETSAGPVALDDLFRGKRQLVIYHFMFGPEQSEGCPHCSFWAEHFDGLAAHLGQRDTTFVVVSRAPLDRLDAFRRRMGWRFDWVSSDDGDFNYDLGASFRPEERATGSAFYNYRTGRAQR